MLLKAKSLITPALWVLSVADYLAARLSSSSRMLLPGPGLLGKARYQTELISVLKTWLKDSIWVSVQWLVQMSRQLLIHAATRQYQCRMNTSSVNWDKITHIHTPLTTSSLHIGRGRQSHTEQKNINLITIIKRHARAKRWETADMREP